MTRSSILAIAAAGLTLAVAAPVSAQETGDPLPVGTQAPDFALTGATADGILPEAIGPSDFRNQTLVIAFFFRARSSG